MIFFRKTFFVWFYLVLRSVAIVKKAKENGNFFFLLFKNIRITVSLGGTLAHMLKFVRLQVPLDKKGKLRKFRAANL